MSRYKWFVVCFIDDGFDGIVGYHLTRKAAQKNAAERRRINDDSETKYKVLSANAMPPEMVV